MVRTPHWIVFHIDIRWSCDKTLVSNFLGNESDHWWDLCIDFSVLRLKPSLPKETNVWECDEHLAPSLIQRPYYFEIHSADHQSYGVTNSTLYVPWTQKWNPSTFLPRGTQTKQASTDHSYWQYISSNIVLALPPLGKHVLSLKHMDQGTKNTLNDCRKWWKLVI